MRYSSRDLATESATVQAAEHHRSGVPAAHASPVVQARFGHRLAHSAAKPASPTPAAAGSTGANAEALEIGALERMPEEAPVVPIAAAPSLARPWIQRAVDLGAPPWPTLEDKGVTDLGGTNESAYLLSFPTGRLVLKPAYDASKVVFAHEMARSIGLAAPAARVLADAEKVPIFAKNRAPFTSGYSQFVLMEHAEGRELDKLAKAGALDLDSDEWEELAEGLGHWLAFDLVIGEGDRFQGMNSATPSLHAGNLMVGQGLTLQGIDMAAMPLGAHDINRGLVARILAEDEALVQSLAKALRTALGVPLDNEDVDLDDVARDVLRAAGEMLAALKEEGDAPAEAAAKASGVDAKIAQQVRANLASF